MDHGQCRTTHHVESRSAFRRALNYVANLVVFVYYLFYFIVKGRDNQGYNNDPTTCAAQKTPFHVAADNKTITNVCCIHGIQTIKSSFSVSENGEVKADKQDSTTASKDSNTNPIKKAGTNAAVEMEAPKSKTELLKNQFERLAEKDRASKQGNKAELGSDDRKGPGLAKRLLYAIYGLFGWMFVRRQSLKVVEQTNDTDQQPTSEEIFVKRIATRDTDVAVDRKFAAPPPAPPPPPSSSQTSYKQSSNILEKSRPTDEPSVTKLNDIEPHYPLSLLADRVHMAELKNKICARAAELDKHEQRHTKAIYVEKPPTSIPEFSAPIVHVKTMPITAIIEHHRKPKVPVEEEEEEEETSEETPVPYSQRYAAPQTFHQSPNGGNLLIRTVYEDDHSKNVQIIKRDWTSPRYKVFGSTPNLSIDSSRSIGNKTGIDQLSNAVHTAAHRKTKHDEQLLQQTRPPRDFNESRFDEQQRLPPLPKMYPDSFHRPHDDFGQSSQTTSNETTSGFPTGAVGHSYSKYSRYHYTSTSSYQSTDGNDPESADQLPKKLRSPQGVHDYQNMSKEYGDNLLTNIASPDKCHELSHILSSDKDAERSIELFHKRRQRAEQFTFDADHPRSSTVQHPGTPRMQVKPDDVIDAVKAAAARRETSFKPIEPATIDLLPTLQILPDQPASHFRDTPAAAYQPIVSHQNSHQGDQYKIVTRQTETVGSRTPAWDRDRLFSPVPFHPTSASRTITPVPTNFLTTPEQSTYLAPQPQSPKSLSLEYSKHGQVNTLPKGWKSFHA